MTQNDNADFISQLEFLTEQMRGETDGMGRAINTSNDWMERANVARVCLEQMELAKAELMGLAVRVCSPPQLPNYNQIPERNQEIEFDQFDPPNMWKRKDIEQFDDGSEMPRRLIQVAESLIKAKREQAA